MNHLRFFSLIFCLVALAGLLLAGQSTPAKKPAAKSDNLIVEQLDLKGLKSLLNRENSTKKLLVMNFWATWCVPCREEFPDFVKMDKEFRDNIQFVTISLDMVSDIKTKVVPFLKQSGSEMPAYILNVKDPDDAINLIDTTWSGQLPATFVVDKDGKIQFGQHGIIDPVKFRQLLSDSVK